MMDALTMFVSTIPTALESATPKEDENLSGSNTFLSSSSFSSPSSVDIKASFADT